MKEVDEIVELNVHDKREASSIADTTANQQQTASKKRRKRNTVVCLPCKKRKIKCDRRKPCGQCCESNASNFCFYSSPQWALDTFLANNKTIPNTEGTAPTALISSNIKNTLAEDNLETVGQDFISQFKDIEKIKDSGHKFDFLLKHLQQVYTAINELQGTKKIVGEGETTPKYIEQAKETNMDNVILLDFHAPFNSLEIKRSSDIGSKPVTTTALICKDPYLSLIFKYYNARTINRKLLKNCYPGEKKTRGHESNIAHSVLDMIKINEDKIPPPNSILDKKQKNDTIWNLPGLISNSSETDQNLIRNDILTMFAEVPVVHLKKYFINYWNFVYPTIPIFDREAFEISLTRILGLDIMSVGNDELHVRIQNINLEETFDLIHVAIFLIMIRFSYLSIITQLKLHATDRLLLKHFKVPTTFFNLANRCLSIYKPFRKSKIILLQFLTMVKSYSLFSVEDGEGNDLNQGTVLKNIVAILVKMMGMNRDPINNIDVFNHCFGESSDKKCYVWRKLFWTLVTLDHKTSSLSGLLSNFDETFMNKFCDTQFPDPKPNFPHHDFEKGICNFLISSNKVSLKFATVIEGTSRLKGFLTVEELLNDLEEMEAELVNNNCNFLNLKEMNISNYTKEIEELEYHLFTNDIILTSLSNLKIIELNIMVLNLQMTCYHSVLINLENKNTKCSSNIINSITLKLITSVKKITDICHMYLNHEFRKYIVKHDYHLNRLVQLTVEKCCLVIASFALKICFTRPSTVEAELIARKHTFHNCLLVMNEMGSLLFNSCGIKYYQGYKSLINLRFIFKLLNYYPFEFTSMAMIQFFISFYNLLQAKINEADSTTQDKIKKLFKNNTYQRGILLEHTLVDFMSKWASFEINGKLYVENKEYDNSLNDTALLSQIDAVLCDFKSIKEQIFEFQVKSSSASTESDKQKENSSMGNQQEEVRKKPLDEAKHASNVASPNMQNFTIITDHNARNILNNTPLPMFSDGNNIDGLFNEKNISKNQHQIPSLLGDEKIVKYLIPGLNYNENREENSIVNYSNNSDSSINDTNNYNDAIMNYGLDVLLGENELFPEDDPFFKLFQ